MKIQIEKSKLKDNLYNFLRKCGYKPFRESYVKLISRDDYPRFHLYIKDEDNKYFFDLHLDQKKPSYGNQNAHSGEYEGEVVEKEAERIQKLV